MLDKPLTQAMQTLSNKMVALFKLTLYLIPLFFLTIREWTHFIAAIAIILACVCLLLTHNKQHYPNHAPWFVLLLALPLLSVFLSQFFRQDWVARAYDAPSRLLLVLPIAALIYQERIDFLKILGHSLTASICLLVLYAIFFPHYQDTQDIALRRLTSPFIDAIFFGFWAMLMGCLTAALGIIYLKNSNKHSVVILYFALAGLAIYLSILSKTRTGWLALPLVILLITIYVKPQIKLKDYSYALGLGLALCLLIYVFVSPVQYRIDLLWQEILLYFSGEAIDTSIGLRIQMWKLGLHLFAENPFFGYGDGGYAQLLEDAKFKHLVSPAAQAMALMAGFHNEFISHAVRSGILGLIAISALLFMPLWIYILHLKDKKKDPKTRATSLIGGILIICMFTASLTNEMLNYKFSMSFFAYLYVSLMADLYWKRNESK